MKAYLSPEQSRFLGNEVVNTGAYKDLIDSKLTLIPQPTILAGGLLGVYFVNAEKMCGDPNVGQRVEELGGDSVAMIDYAYEKMQSNPNFRMTIDILQGFVEDYLDINEKISAISGGQRRDWIFSGPLARVMQLPHISIYKEGAEREFEVVSPDGSVSKKTRSLKRYHALHVVDLVTEGSSIYHPDETGWIPTLRSNGATVDAVVAMIDRLQGAESKLAQARVMLYSLMEIDDAFLRENSLIPNVAVRYTRDPEAWSEQYIRENGATGESIIKAFDPNGGKLQRAKRFIERFGDVIGDAGHMHALDKAVQERYNKPLSEILEVK